MKSGLVVGDTVQLKSGGPLMIVDHLHVGNEAVTCVWFNNNGDYDTAEFNIATLYKSEAVTLAAGIRKYHKAKVKILVNGKVEDCTLNCTDVLIGVIGKLVNHAAIPFTGNGFDLAKELKKENIDLLEIKYHQ